MKFVRFQQREEIKYGIYEDSKIKVLAGDIFNDSGYETTGQIVALSDVTLLAPCLPTKAVCIGLNYRDHAQEMKVELPAEPLIFLKPSSALNHPHGKIVYPEISKNLHYEAELAIVIGKTAKMVKAYNANEYILGYTCANDVTARDLQKGDGQWTRGKSFDTFLPIGPCIETNIDPHRINIKLLLNDEIKQSSNTDNLIFKVPEIIEFVTQVMTLYPGDVILTGTPSGVGPMNIGDTVKVVLEGIGELANIIIKE